MDDNLTKLARAKYQKEDAEAKLAKAMREFSAPYAKAENLKIWLLDRIGTIWLTLPDMVEDALYEHAAKHGWMFTLSVVATAPTTFGPLQRNWQWCWYGDAKARAVLGELQQILMASLVTPTVIEAKRKLVQAHEAAALADYDFMTALDRALPDMAELSAEMVHNVRLFGLDYAGKPQGKNG